MQNEVPIILAPPAFHCAPSCYFHRDNEAVGNSYLNRLTKFQSVSLALFFSSVICTLADVHNLHHQWERRQLSVDSCDGPCAWAAGVANCSTSDVECFCNVLSAAGTQIAPCVACLQPVNATVASDIEQIAEICGIPIVSATTTAATGTITNGPILTGNPTQCSSQCGPIATALTACTDESCLCATIAAQGSACSACFATVNITEASILSVAMSQCLTVPITTNAIPTGCNSQCGLIYLASSSCSNTNACICPTLLAQGAACTSCWATVNATEASVIGASITACQNALYSSTSTSGATSNPTINLATGASSTTRSASGARGGFGEVLGASGMHFILLLAFVAGLLSIFG